MRLDMGTKRSHMYNYHVAGTVKLIIKIHPRINVKLGFRRLYETFYVSLLNTLLDVPSLIPDI